MQKAKLLFDISPWFIVLCLIVGLIYAVVLYQKDGPWGKTTNKFLAVFRFLLVSLLCFLLLGPFLRQINNTVEKPSIVFAIDNSSSISEITDSISISGLLKDLGNLADQVVDNGYDLELRTFSDTYNTTDAGITFDHSSTDLNTFLKEIQSDYEGRGLSTVVLLTDGIYTQGISPTFSSFNFPIHTVGLGDTIPKKDISISAAYYNKIAYQGNKFPIVVEITNNGFVNEQVNVTVKQQDKTLASKTLQLLSENSVEDVELFLEAETEGMQHYAIEISRLDDEFTYKNNTRDAYVDIIDGREKILLVALAPHPDIKVLRSAVMKNENYEFYIYIPGISKLPNEKFDLVIFHQIPDFSRTASNLVEKFNKDKTSLFFVIGGRSDLKQFNTSNHILEIDSKNWEKDQVTPAFNENFSKFNFQSENRSALNSFPPIEVPYGNINFKQASEAILYQRVGSIVTAKPLLAVSDDGEQKSAVLLGEGFWQWRLQEFANSENHEAFDELISKVIQYLSSKEDKRKFKVYPINNEFFDSESVVFETEIYNNIYERIYNQVVTLTITDEQNTTREFSYEITPTNSQYSVTGLPQGVYKFSATTKIDGKSESSLGQFTVKELQIENLNLTANHQLLKKVSYESGGNFYLPEDLNALESDLLDKEAQGIIYSSEAYLPLVNNPWILIILLALVTTEWFTRKYSGGY
ncbi:VWA domain-containing protein [Fulvivirgaceae bacterium BMA10]|uniref:VWA domain-containing protein n=1 Tax=Splendidivirga corallicola TaxID=3051826 RepID=A0ABT8KIH7_9BACT|nr:VWA domain-containing protein [Fulvivirgaceae bacterium BMA10]